MNICVTAQLNLLINDVQLVFYFSFHSDLKINLWEQEGRKHLYTLPAGVSECECVLFVGKSSECAAAASPHVSEQL